MSLRAKSQKKRATFDWTSTPPPPNLTPFQQFFRNVDWAASPLGSIEKWPSQLRQMACIVMADPSPAVVYWGDDATIIYNEAYTHLIGDKHPSLMGSDPKIGFAEVWSHFENILQTGRETGETHVGESHLLLLKRHGFLEETYFTFKFIPIIGDEGYVMGSYATVVEETRQIISDRRMATVKTLTKNISEAKNTKELWPRILHGIGENERDAPLVLLYSVQQNISFSHDADGHSSSSQAIRCNLEGTLGVSPGHVAAPFNLNLDTDEVAFAPAMRRAISEGPQVLRIQDGTLPEELLHGITWRGFGIPCETAVVCPIKTTSSDHTLGLLLIGLNPRRPYDDDYRKFVDLLTTQVTTPHVSAVIFGEEVKRRQHLAREAAADRAKLDAQLRARTQDFEKSEAKFYAFAERVAVGLVTLKLDGKILYANNTWFEITGNTRQILNNEGPSWMSRVYPEDVPMVTEVWKRLVVEKSPTDFQARLLGPGPNSERSDGSITWVLCSAYVDTDAQGDIETISCCLTDISELKRVEDQLRLRTEELEFSENQWKQFADISPIGICRVDAGDFLEYANDAWYNITQVSREDKNPASWVAVIEPEDLPKVASALKPPTEEGGPTTVEFRLKRFWTPPPGHEGASESMKIRRTILGSACTIFNDDGSIRYNLGWLTEITPQKVAEEVLRTRMAEALEMKRQSEHFIDMTSHEMRNPLSAILHCAEEIAFSLEKYRSTGASKLSCPPELSKSLDDVIQAAETITYCGQHQKRIVDDILELSRLDSKLLHILPIPARPVKLVRDCLKVFEAELLRADIKLMFSESPSLRDLGIEWLSLDPGRVLQVLINLITNAIKFTRSESRREILISISAYSVRPSESWTGVEYFPTKQQRDRHPVNFEQTDRGEAIYLCLAVKDTGRGLSHDEIKLLFNRFSQASPKTHTKYGGSGLGLFISRELVELQQGEIGLKSTRGQGSTFVFYVKTKRTSPSGDAILAETAAIASRVKQSQTDGSRFDMGNTQHKPVPQSIRDIAHENSLPAAVAETKPYCLVVEDNLLNQQVMAKQLRSRGCVVDVANHGQEALEFLKQTTFWKGSGKDAKPLTVILLDCEMPVMDGLTCVKVIREMEADGQVLGHVPVIAVTANAREVQIRLALEAGMDDVITKPYTTANMIAKIVETTRRNYSQQNNVTGHLVHIR